MRENENRNTDEWVVTNFGKEWRDFSNERLDESELFEMFQSYMSIFPWASLPEKSVGFDAGCGSGRWAKYVAPKVETLHCVDASPEAIEVARGLLSEHDNVIFHSESVNEFCVEENSCDFGYSLGVLHCVPDTQSALNACASKLKTGAPFLAYLYYDISQSSLYMRILFSIVSTVRKIVSKLPHKVKKVITDLIALFVYFPLARFARLVDFFGLEASKMPLFQYRNRSFYVMRNDSLDRFGTSIEKRFSKEQVYSLFENASLRDTYISPEPPWWVVLAWKA
tara:strand:+ start:280 stop:1122 length:843 start_codon:yes stop_codon:yes gene_type:complete